MPCRRLGQGVFDRFCHDMDAQSAGNGRRRPGGAQGDAAGRRGLLRPRRGLSSGACGRRRASAGSGARAQCVRRMPSPLGGARGWLPISGAADALAAQGDAALARRQVAFPIRHDVATAGTHDRHGASSSDAQWSTDRGTLASRDVRDRSPGAFRSPSTTSRDRPAIDLVADARRAPRQDSRTCAICRGSRRRST